MMYWPVGGPFIDLILHSREIGFESGANLPPTCTAEHLASNNASYNAAIHLQLVFETHVLGD